MVTIASSAGGTGALPAFLSEYIPASSRWNSSVKSLSRCWRRKTNSFAFLQCDNNHSSSEDSSTGGDQYRDMGHLRPSTDHAQAKVSIFYPVLIDRRSSWAVNIKRHFFRQDLLLPSLSSQSLVR